MRLVLHVKLLARGCKFGHCQGISTQCKLMDMHRRALLRLLLVLSAVIAGVSAISLAQQSAGQSQAPKTFQEELRAWSKSHPHPKADASPQEHEEFYRQLADTSAEWVKHWPDDPLAREWRLDALSRLKTTSNAELEQAGDAVLNTLQQHPFKGFMFVPFQTSVAQIWDNHDIRLEQCVALAEAALAEIDRTQKASPSFAKLQSGPVASGMFYTLSVEADAARKLKNFDQAHSAIDRMKHWLDENPGDNSQVTYLYFSQAARLAEAEGHKPDALSYYRLLLNQDPSNSQEKIRAFAIWKELGGTEEGFKLWSEPEPSQAGVAGRPSAWTEMKKPLTALNALDTNGKTWTINDLKGKVSLISVWATWCAPCRAELPAVQKLFEQVKDRSDIQVVTISTDENHNLVDPFVKQGHYLFPVIFVGPSLVESWAGFGGIPRTWIVDANGNIRWERLGYSPSEWPEDVLRKMTTLK